MVVPTILSAYAAAPLPATVPTPLNARTVAPAERTKDEVAPLGDGVPHANIDIDDVKLGKDAAAHLNQTLALHATLPVGSAARSALPVEGVADKVLPEASVSAEADEPKGPGEKDTPAGAAMAGKAVTPSACEPER